MISSLQWTSEPVTSSHPAMTPKETRLTEIAEKKVCPGARADLCNQYPVPGKPKPGGKGD